MTFICESCKEGARRGNWRWHDKCKGGTWCDCQHKGSTR